MINKRFLFGLGLSIAFVILQSTLLQKISVFGIVPDIALIVIVFTSYSSGSMSGQMTGFFTGLVQDFISSGPLGFNALIKTFIGFIYGKIQGKLFLDHILLPVIFIVIATVMKEILISLISLLLIKSSGIHIWGKTFMIELGLNAVLAPFILALLKLLKLYRINKDGY